MDTQEINTLVEESSANRHTEDMQEIITKVPSWILRWGIMVFFAILLMIVGISTFVRYPDTVKASLKVVSSGISTPVVSSADGKITKLFISQSATVKINQPLAEIETIAAPSEVFTLNAPQAGKINFVTIVQPGIFLKQRQVVFAIHPENEQLFGIMKIPSSGINKIKIGQRVLINFRNFVADESGRLTGTISYIADEPDNGGFFEIKVTLNNTGLKKQVELKDWMTGDAEIITQDVSLVRRIYESILKIR